MYERLYSDNVRLLAFFARRYKWALERRAWLQMDDLLQAAFLGLVEAQRTYKADENACAWSTWAGFYIRNQIKDTLGLRSKQLDTVSLDSPICDDSGESTEITLADAIVDDMLPDHDERIIRNEVTKAVREALASIPNEQARTAVQLVHLQDMTQDEAAQEMGLPIGKFINALSKGRNSLRKNKELRKAIPDLDEMTRFHACKGVGTFMRDHTSVVEAAVIWREEHRHMYRET